MKKLFLIVCLAILFPIYSYSQDDIPSFEGYVGQELYGTQKSDAKEFNLFMFDNDGKIVYLLIFLDSVQNEEIQVRDEYDRRLFSVVYKNDEGFNEGAEYLIHLTKESQNYYEYNQYTMRLSGYFKIWEINGPLQGLFSINLRPIEEE
ncbi:MAG: hypothetical protein ISS16_10095 [Ignavibacteria bacterium]|nr:hypothetical protein [Ignavibacteria bacterium]